MKILTAVSNVAAHVDETNIMDFGDPEMFKFPVIYLVSRATGDERAAGRRRCASYLLKGGFLIVDDFPTGPGSSSSLQMSRVFPEGQWQRSRRRRIRSSTRSSRSTTLDIVRRPTRRSAIGRSSARCSRTTIPSKRMYVIANYQNDLSEFWEFSEQGAYPIDETNEAYKVGVNEFIYGITH